MVAKVQGAKEAEGFKLVLCPENSAECYRQEAPPKHDDGIEVRTDRAIHQPKDVVARYTVLTLSLAKCCCMLLQVRGVYSFLEMVTLAFTPTDHSPSDGDQDAVPTAPTAAACDTSAAAAEEADDHTIIFRGRRRDVDDEDYDCK